MGGAKIRVAVRLTNNNEINDRKESTFNSVRDTGKATVIMIDLRPAVSGGAFLERL